MNPAKSVLVPVANGFEEIELVTVVDVLRRAGVRVVVAGLQEGPVLGAHGIAIATDTQLSAVQAEDFDMVVLPGGMPGTTRLMEDPRVLGALERAYRQGRSVAAICAAPMVLTAAGLTSGRRITSHPSVHGALGDADVRAEERVVRDERMVTSQGAGTAMEFALALVEDLVDEATATRLAEAMIVRRGGP